MSAEVSFLVASSFFLFEAPAASPGGRLTLGICFNEPYDFEDSFDLDYDVWLRESFL